MLYCCAPRGCVCVFVCACTCAQAQMTVHSWCNHKLSLMTHINVTRLEEGKCVFTLKHELRMWKKEAE